MAVPADLAAEMSAVVAQVRNALAGTLRILGTETVVHLPGGEPHSVDLRIQLVSGACAGQYGWVEVKWSREGLETAVHNGQYALTWMCAGADGGQVEFKSATGTLRQYPA